MSTPSIRTQVRTDGIAFVTLDAPDRRNAFDLAMCDDMVLAFDALEADPVLVRRLRRLRQQRQEARSAVHRSRR